MDKQFNIRVSRWGELKTRVFFFFFFLLLLLEKDDDDDGLPCVVAEKKPPRACIFSGCFCSSRWRRFVFGPSATERCRRLPCSGVVGRRNGV